MKIENELYKNGFIIVRNLLTDKEKIKFSNIINLICRERNSNRVDDLYNFEDTWEYICNDKLLSILRKEISENIFYMHDSGISNFNSDYHGSDKNKISWHRDTDTASRIKDVVPYCKKSDFYKVFTAITYVSPENKGGTLNIIPKSHKKKFRFSIKNLLRIFHWKTKNKKFFYLIRDIIEKLIGVECKVNSGDCIIFCTTLFHKVVKSDFKRQAIVARYAPKSENSENYLNYVLKQSSNKERIGYDENESSKEKIKSFFKLLKKYNIYYE